VGKGVGTTFVECTVQSKENSGSGRGRRMLSAGDGVRVCDGEWVRPLKGVGIVTSISREFWEWAREADARRADARKAVAQCWIWGIIVGMYYVTVTGSG
jgi:hypothetical protein